MSIRDWNIRQEQIEGAVRLAMFAQDAPSSRTSPAVAVANETSPAGSVTIGQQADAISRRLRDLGDLGVYTAADLAAAVRAQARRPALIGGLIRSRSVNLLVGDSGLGKTPLAIQIGLSVASGVALFGHPVLGQGPVLYCDAESDLTGFSETLSSVSQFLGLADIPHDFHVWSPNWDTRVRLAEASTSIADRLISRAYVAQAALVIVDPLRVFWPNVEKGSDDAVRMIEKMREVSRATGASWLLIHHRRKTNQQFGVARLQDEPHLWFQEAAGSHALVNQTDTRIGVVPHSGQADLLLAGFVRGTGPIVPLDLARTLDDEGTPRGYRLLTGLEQLNSDDVAVYKTLPARFRFKDVQTAMGGTSGSNANRFIKRCSSLEIVKKEGSEYVKCVPAAVERVE